MSRYALQSKNPVFTNEIRESRILSQSFAKHNPNLGGPALPRGTANLYEYIKDGDDEYYAFITEKGGKSGTGQFPWEAEQLRNISETKMGTLLEIIQRPDEKTLLEDVQNPDYLQKKERVLNPEYFYSNSNGQYPQFDLLPEGKWGPNVGNYLDRTIANDNARGNQIRQQDYIFNFWKTRRQRAEAASQFSSKLAGENLKSLVKF